MGVVFRLRGPDGKYVKGNVNHLEKAIEKFGSNVIKEGRKILNQKNKRTQNNTLFSNYHYKMKSTGSTISMAFEFGNASHYWKFIDQGVRGTGGIKRGKTKAGEYGVRRGTGLARGRGSDFEFKYESPGGMMVNAIKGWIKNKPISLGDMNENSLAWAIGYSIKRRGLERTMFYTRPVTKALKTLPDELKEAFKLDFKKLIDKLPNSIEIITTINT